MKHFFFLSVVLFLLLALFSLPRSAFSLAALSRLGFEWLFEREDARAVFDLEEEEAITIFGETDGERVFV